MNIDIDINSKEFIQNRFYYYNRLYQSAPICFLQKNNCWLVTGYSEVARLLSDNINFPSYSKNGKDVILLGSDEPYHSVNRAIVSEFFNLLKYSNVNNVIDYSTVVATKLVGHIKKNSPTELINDFISPYTVSIALKIIGIDTIVSHYGFLFSNDSKIKSEISILNGLVTDTNKFNALVDEAFKNNNLKEFINIEFIKSNYNMNEVKKFIRTLFVAGSETSSSLLSSSLYLLMKDEGLYNLINNEPERRLNFINEVLRYYSPGQIVYRKTTSDISIGDKFISKDSIIAVCIGAANHDPQIFNNPYEFNVFRENTKSLAFGKGIHYCIGSHVAKASVAIALNFLLPLLEKFKLNIDDIEYYNAPEIFKINKLSLKNETASI